MHGLEQVFNGKRIIHSLSYYDIKSKLFSINISQNINDLSWWYFKNTEDLCELNYENQLGIKMWPNSKIHNSFKNKLSTITDT